MNILSSMRMDKNSAKKLFGKFIYYKLRLKAMVKKSTQTKYYDLSDGEYLVLYVGSTGNVLTRHCIDELVI